MEYGIALASEIDSWRWVQRAEELGFSSAWFYDTQLLNPDVFICMALAAEKTERIRLGTGVLVPLVHGQGEAIEDWARVFRSIWIGATDGSVV